MREKRVKRWPRAWKYDLIQKLNPTWRELAEDFGFPDPQLKQGASRLKAGMTLVANVCFRPIADINNSRKLLVMKPAAMLLFALTAAAPPSHREAVSNFRCGTTEEVSMADFDTVDSAFIQRSIAIVAASLANDSGKLKSLVSPDAANVYFAYDNGMRSPGGPAGIISLIRSIAPRHYEFLRGKGLPPATRRPCDKISVDLTLLPVRRDRASIATFNYERGVLVELVIHDGEYAEGNFARPSVP